ncbi:cytochrome c biogenesis protein CcsB [Arthrobacter sp. Hiyo8]|nr:cytochrome c biogenesis protein CcsB [Arthrobacter sp. Hiyo8]
MSEPVQGKTKSNKSASESAEADNAADNASGSAAGKAAGKAIDKAKAEAALPVLGIVGMLRWAWTQLTSMRTALFLLLLLAVAAVPGSLFPQRPANPSIVTQYISDHPDYGKLLDSVQLYDVYSSAWFSAIYILLFISLIGCVTPRAIAHYKAMRSQPPRTPKRLSRLPEYGTLVLPADAGIPASKAISDAAAVLKKRGYRVEVRDVDAAMPSLGAERGFLKEVGNLVFHASLIGVLVSVAVGGLFGYSGQRILVEGDTFVNTLVGYDQFSPGTNFQSSWLQPYSIQLNKFDVKFDRESSAHFGQPIDFTADVTTKDTPDAPAKKQVLKVNDPVSLGDTSIYLTGNGYAPVVTVRDGAGNVAMQGLSWPSCRVTTTTPRWSSRFPMPSPISSASRGSSCRRPW